MHPIIQQIVSVFEKHGNEKYGDELVTQLQHALQCAALARQADATESMVVAALLHDVGHILYSAALPADCEVNLDDDHERVGYEFLHQHFGDEVADPVRLHVPAKRYLCTKEEDYRAHLSPTSLKSFFDQGGDMDEAELRQFEQEKYFLEAIQLRRWDDTAKVEDDHSTELGDYLEAMESVLLPGARV